MSTTDEEWMREAFRLADLSPPSETAYAVGAIIVDVGGRVLARGFSRDSGPRIHAEESALAKVDGDPRLAQATLYSTLEPCSQRASPRTPCAQLILASGLRRVVMADREPGQFVADPQGYEVLTAGGVGVVELPSAPREA